MIFRNVIFCELKERQCFCLVESNKVVGMASALFSLFCLPVVAVALISLKIGGYSVVHRGLN